MRMPASSTGKLEQDWELRKGDVRAILGVLIMSYTIASDLEEEKKMF